MNITLENLTKRFPARGRKAQGEVTAVEDLTFEIPDGMLVGLLGPSGCGKSTTLNMICGLETPTSGKIFFGEEDVTALAPELRGVGMVFQNYALYPHLTVMQNILFPLENLKGKERPSRQEMRRRALETAKLVQIEELLERKPRELSGGQQQRVAIARALVKMPRVLLLDEPLSNLDARLRLQTREEIVKIQKRTGITTLFVTHDQEEAMSISDRIVVMRNGLLMQQGAPQQVYDDPACLFVAKFLGTPPINKLSATMRDGKILLDGSDISLSLPLKQAPADGTAVVLAVRAESICLAGQGGASLKAEVKEGYSIGKDELVLLQVGQAQQMRGFVPGNEVIREGDCLSITLGQKGVFLFDAQTGERFA